jgi:hypothetical protein
MKEKASAPPLTLEEMTLQYWNVSKVFNGQSKKKMSVGQAIQTSRQCLSNLNPARPLWSVFAKLQNAIIYQEETSPKAKEG